MTPAALARLHARCFTTPPPWSEASFAALLDSPHVFALTASAANAFALGRVIGPEAELLTLATDPDARRQGLARALLAEFERAARARAAETLFLEVAETNTAALALYTGWGFTPNGRRPGYFGTPDGKPLAALLLCKPLG